MSEKDNRVRRIAYIRWRLRQEKEVSEDQRRELNRYDAEKHGAHFKALDRLSFEDTSTLSRLRADQLLELAKDATLVSDDESLTKKEMLARIRTFQKLGLLAAKQAA
jgi:hypothetical protein